MRKRVIAVMNYPSRDRFERVSYSRRGQTVLVYAIRRSLHSLSYLTILVDRVVREQVVDGVPRVCVCYFFSVGLAWDHARALAWFTNVLVDSIYDSGT